MDFSTTKGVVERAIESFGVKAEAVRVEATDTQATYSLMRGSALTLVSVALREAEVVLRVACPVMSVPHDDKRAALFQRLLELNANPAVGGAAFALAGDRIVVVSERPGVGLDETEAAHVIRRASAVADTFDDRLVTEFGGEKASAKV